MSELSKGSALVGIIIAALLFALVSLLIAYTTLSEGRSRELRFQDSSEMFPALSVAVYYAPCTPGATVRDLMLTLRCLARSPVRKELEVFLYEDKALVPSDLSAASSPLLPEDPNIAADPWGSIVRFSNRNFRAFTLLHQQPGPRGLLRVSLTAKAHYLSFLPAGVCPRADWVQRVCEAFAGRAQGESSVAVVGSRVHYQGIVEAAVVDYRITRVSRQKSQPMPLYLLQGLSVNDSRAAASRSVLGVGHVGMTVVRSLFISAGGLDTSLFPHFDALDFCLKMISLDKNVLYCGDCDVERLGPSPLLRGAFRSRDPLTEQALLFGNKWQKLLESLLERRYATRRVTLRWSSPVTTMTGFATEAIAFLLGIETLVPIKLVVDPAEYLLVDALQLPECYAEALRRMQDRHLPALPVINFELWTAERFWPPRDVVYSIGRSTYESGGVPPPWLDHFLNVDELWVPTEFNWRTYTQYGVTNHLEVL
eukprot:NODE_148_length_3044_cov_14.360601_g136_i0.p1 GENE.NODE_148_length_3044_cov_14.360601_g136_i0~~NODE_148_length_3044_cov_14.360601_g136_i0.p1  ORF type:complete len:544 (-),score=85.94 NODE_148_length_3044_cov_14.360601_g136_i0:1411-2853(-)